MNAALANWLAVKVPSLDRMWDAALAKMVRTPAHSSL